MIYICIPTHNEQQTVGVVLWKLRQVLTEFPRDYQLLVADDGSSDKTPEVLEPYTRVLPLTVIRSDTKQGAAASLEMLLREAVRRSEYPKRDVIVTLQADFSDEPDDMVPLIKRLEAGADVAVGNKVSSMKETRSRRFARSLARFFVRGQKWPEGVVSPFDGYRAYRLYAVKRAMEERGTGRLLRYDGWAGNAEMLKAVLPHARRVDVVDVDDRPDRLQRARREKPFASAMQVRVMSAGTEPPRLAGVEELDRIALTASRSRDRTAITPQSIQAGRGAARTNGSRTRQQSARREQGQGRTRSQANGAGRTATEGAAPRPRRDRQSPGEGRSRQKSGEQPRKQQGERTRRPPQAAETAQAAEEPVIAVDGAPSDAPPKRKRRRRKRGGQGRSSTAALETGTSADASPDAGDGDVQESPQAGSPRVQRDAAATPDAADAAGEDTPEGGEKKRRRRGGRRGGRGRRKPRPEGAEAGPVAGESNAGEGSAEPPTGTASGERIEASAIERPAAPAPERAAEPVARVENDQE